MFTRRVRAATNHAMNTPLIFGMDAASAVFTVDLFYKDRMANNISGKAAFWLGGVVEVE